MTNQPQWTEVTSTDDWTLYRDATGEYVEELEIRETCEDTHVVHVYRFSVDRMTWHIDEDNQTRYMANEFGHDEWWQESLPSVASSIGESTADLIDALCSDDALTRAMVYLAIAGYHGAVNFDQYPCIHMDDEYHEEFRSGYTECLLWCGVTRESSDGECESAEDGEIDESDLTDEIRSEITQQCRDFVDSNAELLARVIRDEDASQAGHDFYLTRNGHGAGFWDRGLGRVGNELSDAARPYGTYGLMMWEDEDGTIKVDSHG